MTLTEMLNSDDYQRWKKTVWATTYLSTTRTCRQLHEYAEEDSRSTIIDYSGLARLSADAVLPDSVKESLLKEIDAAEEWHIENGSINNIIGD